MSHWAEIDDDSIVIRVTVGDDTNGEQAAHDWLVANLGGRWVQCSYNGRIRKQFPGAGFRYDEGADVFVAPQPYPSWGLDENFDWQPPVPMPDDGMAYVWNEALSGWEVVPE